MERHIEMKCPNCGDETHLYRNGDVRWVPDLEEWQLVYVDYTVDCTECSHEFDYEGEDDETV
jgi:uncharacterized Zn finger protein